MSINLTQEFLFETDDIKSFEKVLSVIVPIVYHHPKIHKTSHGFDYSSDGREYSNQYSMVPIGETYALIKPNATFGGLTVQEIIESFPSKDACSIKASQLRVEPKPTRQWVTTLSESWSWERPLDGKYYKGTKGNGNAINQVMKIVKDVDMKKYASDFSHVKDEIYSWFDGSIGYGYRMELDSGEELHISLTHILYGK